MTEEPPRGIRHDAIGVHGLQHGWRTARTVRVVVTEQQLGPSSEPTLRDLSEALIAVYGTDFGVHNPTWISRFTDMTRQAAAYRAGRVLLAGDAAHVHYPAGGQGLSLGVQDAVNLGWKLAQVVDGTSPESLLDTYHDERHPVAARALQHTMAQAALQRRDERMQALVDVVSELASMDEPRKRLAGIISGLDIHYDLGEGHPLLGRRMPDLDLVTADGPLRVFELLHDARPVLLNLGEPGGFDITPWADRVQLIDASYEGEWELPVLGAVTAPTAVLIRPDGYVAWVGDGTDLGLADALTTWFGPPRATGVDRVTLEHLAPEKHRLAVASRRGCRVKGVCPAGLRRFRDAPELHCCDREQALLMPPSLREWLPEDHLGVVRVGDGRGDGSVGVLSRRIGPDGHGRAAYEPAMMVGVVVLRVRAREAVLAGDRAGVRGGRRLSGDRGEPGA